MRTFSKVPWVGLALFLSICGCGKDDAHKSDGGGQGGQNSGASSGAGSVTEGGTKCAEGYTCYDPPGSNVVWVMKNDGNVNGPNCSQVCEAALSQNCAYRACDEGRAVEQRDIGSFAPIAAGLGFTCRPGGCWDSVAPAQGLYLVSKETASDGSKTCYFPSESRLSCSTDPGNANCFGERYASVCPCVPKALDEACEFECPPHNTTRAVWRTSGTSCLERINYWRKRACEEGWVECPPAGLPPMVECTACHECVNSEAQTDSKTKAHASFTRCGEFVQGEGGGKTCADTIDAFVSERAPDENGVMRCQGHCGPIVAPGCQTFSWGKAKDSNFMTLNWGNCAAATCQDYCKEHPGECFTHELSPSLTCADPEAGKEAGPRISACE